MNAGIGVALVAVSLGRQGVGLLDGSLVAPLMLAFWTIIGLRAAFYVPSELPSAWTFNVNASAHFDSYARGVRAAIVALVAPVFGAVAFAVGGWTHAARTVLSIVVLADVIVLTIDFLPFTRAYRPGHAKLKTRSPIYAIGAYAFAYGLVRVPPVLLLVPVAALELTIGRSSRHRWAMAMPSGDAADDDAVVTLDLIGLSTVDIELPPQSVIEEKQPLVQGTLGDVRYAFRLLHCERAFSLLVVATMAIAIGANVTLFTIVNGMGGRPSIPHEERAIGLASADRAGHPFGVSYADFQDWRSQTRTVALMVAYRGVGMNLTDRGLTAERATSAYISAETFQLLGERPILGRDFSIADDQPGAAPVVILGGGLWKARYGGDPAIIGKTIRANGVAMTVIGVMRPGFRFPLVHDLWLPLATAAPDLLTESRDTRTLQVVARLKDGVSVEQARADLAGIGDALSSAYPRTNRDTRPVVTAYADTFSIANPWDAMLLAVSFVLIIGCANVANLLLARGARRANEIAIRTSIGATRWQLIRQLLVEHSILAGAAGAIGLALGVTGVHVWVSALPALNWPYWYDFTIQHEIFSYLFAITVACAVLFGVGPAIVTSRQAATQQPRFWTNGLLVVEFTLTLALLTGAGLLAKTLAAVYRADSIVDTSDVVLASIDLPPQRYRTSDQQLVVYRALEDRLATLPDVEAASLASAYPFYDAPRWLVELEGASTSMAAPLTASYVMVGPRYFDTLRLKLREGRPFTRDDGGSGHEAVIVNEQFVSMYLRGSNPTGRRLRLIDPRAPSPKQQTSSGAKTPPRSDRPLNCRIDARGGGRRARKIRPNRDRP
jgi:predicted permease